MKHTVIASSILNKFNDWPMPELLDLIYLVDRSPERVRLPYEENLLEDVRLQLECFRKIETEWVNLELAFNVLVSINALITGEEEDQAVFRTREHVRDFGGRTPTKLEGIPKGITSIECILKRLHQVTSGGEPSELAEILAEAFCSIINVHPFEDGNGRTARFLVQLGLLKAGYEYVELPKYRNDSEWRRALDLGTHKDFSAAAAFLLKRLHPKGIG